MVEKRRGRIIRFAPLVLWTAIVLGLSTSGGSLSRTSRFIRPVLEFLFPGAPESTLVLYHFYLRKLAHFTEYGILAFIACFAFRAWGSLLLRSRWPVIAFFYAASVAVIDELHQSFVPDRTGSVADVVLDLAGAFAAVALCVVANHYRKIDKSPKVHI